MLFAEAAPVANDMISTIDILKGIGLGTCTILVLYGLKWMTKKYEDTAKAMAAANARLITQAEKATEACVKERIAERAQHEARFAKIEAQMRDMQNEFKIERHSYMDKTNNSLKELAMAIGDLRQAVVNKDSEELRTIISCIKDTPSGGFKVIRDGKLIDIEDHPRVAAMLRKQNDGGDH